MSNYHARDVDGHIIPILEELPLRAAVATALGFLEGYRMNSEEIARMALILKHKKPDEANYEDISYNDCDTEFGKGMKYARRSMIRDLAAVLADGPTIYSGSSSET